MAKPIPEGYHAITPYFVVNDAQKLIDFLKQAFNAQFAFEPMKRPDGSIMHAELKIGDSRVMLGNANENNKPTQNSLYLYVPDVDATYKRAVAAGGKSTMEPADMFYGDRTSCVKDFAGNQWFIGTHKEDVAPDELKRRAEKMFKEQKAKSKAA